MVFQYLLRKAYMVIWCPKLSDMTSSWPFHPHPHPSSLLSGLYQHTPVQSLQTQLPLPTSGSVRVLFRHLQRLLSVSVPPSRILAPHFQTASWLPTRWRHPHRLLHESPRAHPRALFALLACVCVWLLGAWSRSTLSSLRAGLSPSRASWGSPLFLMHSKDSGNWLSKSNSHDKKEFPYSLYQVTQDGRDCSTVARVPQLLVSRGGYLNTCAFLWSLLICGQLTNKFSAAILAAASAFLSLLTYLF